LFPASGTFATPFELQFTPSNQTCPGDNTGGWVYSPFITQEVDSAPLTFSVAGSPNVLTAGVRSLPWKDTGGDPQRNFFPSLRDPAVNGGDSAFVNNLSNLSFGATFATPVLPAAPGVYTVGVACFTAIPQVGPPVLGVRENAKFWTTQITVASAPVTAANPQGLIWGQPAVPAAPVLTPSASSAAAPTVNFTQAPAIPSVSGYTATLTQTSPAGAAITINPAPNATSITLPALTLGTVYSLSMVATNLVGNSVPSNTVILSPSTTAPAPIPITVPNPFERAGFDIGWTVPATGPAPDNYTVQIFTAPTTGAPALVTTFSNVSGTTVAVPAGPAAPTAPTYAVGNYTARVTANYTTSPGVTATAGNQAFSVTPSTLIFQEITVERPPGALVLTQRCGVYGNLPAFGPVVGFPGFPRTVLAQGPEASTAGIDERPDTDVVPPGNRTIGEYTFDVNFPNYPEIGTYPSECGLDMGVARLVTSGDLAGQFYTASGRLNQVTVLDTRDIDAGWTAKGDIDNLFQQGSGGTGLEFAGNYLGWVPIVTDDSDPVGGSTYNQTVVAGLPVLPGTGTTAAPTPAAGFNSTGLQDAPTLASAAVGAGLGIATLDARMNLLIPASIDRGATGTYTATLSLTVA